MCQVKNDYLFWSVQRQSLVLALTERGARTENSGRSQSAVVLTITSNGYCDCRSNGLYICSIFLYVMSTIIWEIVSYLLVIVFYILIPQSRACIKLAPKMYALLLKQNMTLFFILQNIQCVTWSDWLSVGFQINWEWKIQVEQNWQPFVRQCALSMESSSVTFSGGRCLNVIHMTFNIADFLLQNS